MAVSGSVDFNLTAINLIEEARAMLGVHADEEPLEDHEAQRAFRVLNMMLKAWQADGIFYWTMTEGTLTLVQSQASYTFQSGGDFTTVPFDLHQVRITRSSTDIEMFELSREDYFRLPDKTIEGYPTNWFYDRQRASGRLYVWPVPDSTAGTLKFTYRRILNDMDVNADDMDLPQEWFEAVTANLAERLTPYYGKSGTPRAQDIAVKAATSYQTVRMFNVAEGEGSISILPAMGR